MRNLIRRLFPIPGRHRGRPALVASGLTESDRRRNRQYEELSPLLRAWARRNEHQGATEYWSPTAELAAAEDREPEETPEEAAVREAEGIFDHWAAEERRFADEVRSWFDDLVKDDPIAQQLLGEERERLARKASVEAADHAAEPTGEYPIVRELVSA